MGWSDATAGILISGPIGPLPFDKVCGAIPGLAISRFLFSNLRVSERLPEPRESLGRGLQELAALRRQGRKATFPAPPFFDKYRDRRRKVGIAPGAARTPSESPGPVPRRNSPSGSRSPRDRSSWPGSAPHSIEHGPQRLAGAVQSDLDRVGLDSQKFGRLAGIEPFNITQL